MKIIFYDYETKISIADLENYLHIPRVGEGVTISNKTYSVYQNLFDYDKSVINIFLKEYKE